MSRQLQCALCASLLAAAACALPDQPDAGKQTAVEVATLPSSTVTAPSDPSPISAPSTALPAGFILRSVKYPTLCVAAADTPIHTGSRLILAPCQAVAAQAFTYYRGSFSLQANWCITGTSVANDPLTLQVCDGTSAQTWTLSADTHVLYQNNSGLFAAQVNDSSPGGANLLAAALDNNTAFAMGPDDVPGTAGLLLYDGNHPTYCLSDLPDGLTTRPCDGEATEQIWSLRNNYLRAATGYCIAANVLNPNLLVRVACGLGGTSAEPNSLGRWYQSGNALRFEAPPTFSKNFFSVSLAPPSAPAGVVTTQPFFTSNNASWSFGKAP